MKIDNQLSKSSPSKEKRKLTKEKLKLKPELSECLEKITIKEIKNWHVVMEHAECSEKKTEQLRDHLKELNVFNPYSKRDETSRLISIHPIHYFRFLNVTMNAAERM